jgi:hypothetical protein
LHALETENVYSLMTRLVASTYTNCAFIEVESAIPCIMHGVTRLKKISWGNCLTKADRDILRKTVEDYIDTGIFGTEDSQSQWKLPVTNEAELDKVSFTAWRIRKYVNAIKNSFSAQRVY